MSPHIYQFLMGYSKGDAISNFAEWIHSTFTSHGLTSRIYTENFDKSINSSIYHYKQFSEHFTSNALIIVHYSLGSSIVQYLSNFNVRVIVIFHGITPPEWFQGVNPVMQLLAQQGYDELPLLRSFTSQTYAVSDHASTVLKNYGFTDIKIFPPMIDLSRFDDSLIASKINKSILDKRVINFLFVGRVIPQKRQDVLIRFLHRFQALTMTKARLTLVGSYSDYRNYYYYLQELTKFLNLENNVIFAGHTSSVRELSLYYKESDFFLCASQWESFCVPIIEAIYHRMPVICAKTSAAANTLGNSGILIDSFDSDNLCFVIDEMFKNKELNDLIIANQLLEINVYSIFSITDNLMKLLKDFIDNRR